MESKTKETEDLFDDLKGQLFAKKFLRSILKTNQLSNAYLLSGPEGVGRKLATFRFLEGLLNNGQVSKQQRKRLENFNHPDVLWIEPTYQSQGKLIPKSQKENLKEKTPPKIRLEQVREVSRFLSRFPLEAKLGIVIMEGVETMAESAANALLKTLEEPGNGLLILITSRPEKLLQTIHSRCQRIPFYPLNKADFETVIADIYKDSEYHRDASNDIGPIELNILSNGSPGALIENVNLWDDIPKELWPRLKKLPKKSIEALSLAKDITENINLEQQIWIINWLQLHLWNKSNNDVAVKRLEKLRIQLVSFVQPRLSWEIALLDIKEII